MVGQWELHYGFRIAVSAHRRCAAWQRRLETLHLIGHFVHGMAHGAAQAVAIRDAAGRRHHLTTFGVWWREEAAVFVIHDAAATRLMIEVVIEMV